jgi:hypothetical protein
MIEEEKKKQMEVFQKQSSGEGSQGKGKLWSEAEIQKICLYQGFRIYFYPITLSVG